MCVFICVCICSGVSSNSYVILKTGDREELKSVLGGSRITEDSASYWQTSQTHLVSHLSLSYTCFRPLQEQKMAQQPQGHLESRHEVPQQHRAHLTELCCSPCSVLGVTSSQVMRRIVFSLVTSAHPL